MRKRQLAALLNKPSQIQLILGTQWGDEGKGKIVDILSEDAEIIARFQGGANAGHTVKFNNKTYILHLLPSGILRPQKSCIIGNGVVIHPESLIKEIEELESNGIDVLNRLFISYQAHLILPYHKRVEEIQEADASGWKIGTTRRGIGPAYADKAGRTGIRVGDVLDWDYIREKVKFVVSERNRVFESIYQIPKVQEKEVLDSLRLFLDKVKGCIADTNRMMHDSIDKGKSILLEGAQGALLDIDFGTYPYVTSSNTSIGGVSTGLGIGPKKIHRIIGVIKAYCTRVGDGPFPTELSGPLGESLRESGGEYGATTGRPRRCGWFDAVLARYACRIDDVDCLALTKLDVLDNQDEIQICNGYKLNGKPQQDYLMDRLVLGHVEPVYETMSGWKADTSGIRSFNEMPKETQNYIRRLEELVGVPVALISVGPGREETILL
jgi:adenylosuccinate synthase